MKKEEFAARYPGLYHLLVIMSHDNDLTMKDVILEGHSGVHFWDCENNCYRLHGEEEFLIMAAGEESERKALVDARGIWNLDSFLEAVFDGDLHRNVWE